MLYHRKHPITEGSDNLDRNVKVSISEMRNEVEKEAEDSRAKREGFVFLSRIMRSTVVLGCSPGCSGVV